jgi:hypothetical protein
MRRLILVEIVERIRRIVLRSFSSTLSRLDRRSIRAAHHIDVSHGVSRLVLLHVGEDVTALSTDARVVTDLQVARWTLLTHDVVARCTLHRLRSRRTELVVLGLATLTRTLIILVVLIVVLLVVIIIILQSTRYTREAFTHDRLSSTLGRAASLLVLSRLG